MRFRDDVRVEVVQYAGSDEMVARAARASTGKDQLEAGKIDGLIGYLARERHTSPFEHSLLTVRVEAPIFVAREWMRHRTQSYSELSLRFAEASPEFYVPGVGRPLRNAGSGAHPNLVHDESLHDLTVHAHESAYVAAFAAYSLMIDAGVATEVARDVLPVGIYTTFYASANLMNWIRFLTLRNGREGAPQYEIVQGARQVETLICDMWPASAKHWKLEKGEVA